MRPAQLADESADGLAHRGWDEVKLTRLDRPPKWPLLRCRLMAGFQMSTEVRFAALLSARLVDLVIMDLDSSLRGVPPRFSLVRLENVSDSQIGLLTPV
jgi:hypothetical protein